MLTGDVAADWHALCDGTDITTAYLVAESRTDFLTEVATAEAAGDPAARDFLATCLRDRDAGVEGADGLCLELANTIRGRLHGVEGL